MTNYDTLKEYEAHKEPLPSYDEYKRLQEQLKEANKLIKWVVKTSWSGNQEEDDFDRYLEKWGVK